MHHKEIKKMEKIEQEIADLEEQVEALQNQIENKKDQLIEFERLKKEQRQQKCLNHSLEQELLLRSLEINKENRNELFNMIKTVKESLKKDLNNLKEHHKTTKASEEDCKEDILAISEDYNWHLDELKNKIKVLDKVIQQQSIQ